jgi:hypothetical protein
MGIRDDILEALEKYLCYAVVPEETRKRLIGVKNITSREQIYQEVQKVFDKYRKEYEITVINDEIIISEKE